MVTKITQFKTIQNKHGVFTLIPFEAYGKKELLALTPEEYKRAIQRPDKWKKIKIRKMV